MTPPEICDIHDLRIDEYGCWACGHSGPITDDVAPSWLQWCLRWPYGMRVDGKPTAWKARWRAR